MAKYFWILLLMVTNYSFINSVDEIDSEEENYRRNISEQKCLLEGVAGNQPLSICHLIRRFSQAVSNTMPYRNALLLYGPPGTGKTTIAEIIARMAGAEFIHKSASSMITSMQGSGAQSIKDIFEIEVKGFLNANKKVVLFIDEIDAFTKGRTSNSNDDHVNALLELMQKVVEYKNNKSLIIIVATNKKEFLDDGILSRFETIEIPLPNKQMCEAIFVYHMKKFPHKLEDKMPFYAAKAYHSQMSGRDIENVVNDAYLRSESTGATKVLNYAVNDALQSMIKKKEDEQQEKNKKEAKEKMKSEISRMQYESYKHAEEERWIKKLNPSFENE